MVTVVTSVMTMAVVGTGMEEEGGAFILYSDLLVVGISNPFSYLILSTPGEKNGFEIRRS